jgi:hypothetical protein
MSFIQKPSVEPYFLESWKQWNGKDWVLTRDWGARVRTKSFNFRMDVCRGFITDFGSIPKFWLWRVNPYGSGIVGFLPHDIGYGTHIKISSENIRSDYDLLLYELLDQQTNFIWSKKQSIYRAVQAGGYFAYNKPDDIIERNRNLAQIEIIK